MASPISTLVSASSAWSESQFVSNACVNAIVAWSCSRARSDSPRPARIHDEPAAVRDAGRRVRDLVRDERDVALVVCLALELLAEAHHRDGSAGVSVAGAQPRILRLQAQGLCVLRAAGEHRVDRCPQRGVPLEAGQPQLSGEPRVPCDLLPPCGHLPELEQIDDTPVVGLQFGMAVA